MFKLNNTPDKAEYLANMNTVCKLGMYEVSVEKKSVSTKSGSWARGWKFHDTQYGLLLCHNKDKQGGRWTADHGKTWAHSSYDAIKVAKRNKIVLERTTTKEFAYDSIQRINAQYGY